MVNNKPIIEGVVTGIAGDPNPTYYIIEASDENGEAASCFAHVGNIAENEKLLYTISEGYILAKDCKITKFNQGDKVKFIPDESKQAINVQSEK